MTVSELMKLLGTIEDKDRLVVVSKDSEGNSFSPLAEPSLCGYQAYNTWSGDVGIDKLTPDLEKQGFTEEDVRGVPAVCLWPTD